MTEPTPRGAAGPSVEEDAASRAAALDAGRSFIVQAPAGSGKTELLIQRVLVLLARVEQPEQIVAITFTRKAAAEMRARVLRALASASGAAPAEAHKRLTYDLAREVAARDAARGWHLGENASRLRMLTFDALWREIALRRPLLARLGGAPGVTEDAGALYREAARATLATVEQGGGAGDAVSALLLHVDGDAARAEALLVRMLGRRDQWLRHLAGGGETPQARREALEAALRELAADTLAELHGRWPAHHLTELEALLDHAAAERADRDAPLAGWEGVRAVPGAADPDALEASLTGWRAAAALLLTDKGEWRKQVTEKQGFPAPTKARNAEEKQRRTEMKQRMTALLDALSGEEALRAALDGARALPYLRYPDAQWEVLDALLTLLPASIGHLQAAFAARGAMDFAEVAACAARVLESRRGSDAGGSDAGANDPVRHLLVDEFQDTSHLQYRLIEALTADWREGDGRTLFCVGDPMQSIYRFREAEVGLFLRARQRGIGALRLVPPRLAVNFRAEQALVDWCNGALPHALPAEESVERSAVPFTPAQAAPHAGAGTPPTVHAQGVRDDQAEAEAVAAVAGEASRRGSVAILVRARTHLAAILPALRAAGVRYRALEIESLGERPAVMDLFALTRALLHGGDRIAWLAILRAPWSGMRLADLLALMDGAGGGTVWPRIETPPAGLPPEALARLARVREAMEAALESEGRLDLRRRVEDTWIALGGPACVDEAGMADARAYLDLLDALEASGDPVDAPRIEEAMAKLFAPPDAAPDIAVDVMTIHKAKGLEFDTVILPGLGRGPRHDDPQMLLWWERPAARPRETGQGGTGLLLAPLGERGDTEPFHEFLRGIERDKARHETGRLLYVAVTRAKRALHLFGQTAGLPRKGSFLERLWPAVSGHFDAVAAPEDTRPERPAGPEYPSSEIHRLVDGWQRPAPPPPVPRGGGMPGMADPVSAADEVPPPVEYLWAGAMSRHVGTVAHRALQRMADLGAAAQTSAWIARRRGHHRAELMRLGVAHAQLDEAVRRVEGALAQAITDERGRWVLREHAQSECELALTTWEGGRPVEVILDRTFVDADGTRWIVDYKTGQHEGADAEGFLDKERERYQPQLERYARILARMREHPPGGKIMLGLYFPLMRGWRAWEAPKDRIA